MIPEAMFTYRQPRPSVCADVAIFAENQLCLIHRGKEPYRMHVALPGGHVDPGSDGFGELIADAAVREVEEELGVFITPSQLNFVGIYDTPRRDPRGWRISVLYMVMLSSQPELQAGDDAATAFWADLDDFLLKRHFAFDHEQLVKDAIDLYKMKKGEGGIA